MLDKPSNIYVQKPGEAQGEAASVNQEGRLKMHAGMNEKARLPHLVDRDAFGPANQKRLEYLRHQ